jgi:hypothetical protein
MASPRRRRLIKAVRAGKLKAAKVVEAVVEAITPAKEEVPAPLVEAPVVEAPVVKEEDTKAAPKAAPKAKKYAKKGN